MSVRSLPSLGATTFNMGGRELAGHYQIRHQIGQGGMGFVYLAYEPRAERYVAIKVVHPSFFHDEAAIERFTREAQAASQLRHHNTTAVFDFGRTDEGLYFMVLELLRGRSCWEALQDGGPFQYPRAVKVLRQICGSLAEAHALGIVHRDLKPENIMLETVGGKPDFVKVLDFGIAQVPQAGDSRMTQPGEVCGTPIYMSPEQAAGVETDHRSDIYSLGVLLWELLTGDPPFGDAPPLAVMMKHVYEALPAFPEPYATRIPRPLVDLIFQMLEKKPDKRPPDCKTLRVLLRDAAGLEASSQPLAGQPSARAPVNPHGGPSAHMRPAAHGFVPAPQVERLPRALAFRSANGQVALKLGASGPEKAVVYCGATPARTGSRLVMLGDEEILAGVRVIGDVEGPAPGYPEGCVEVAWVRVVSGGGRQLRQVLEMLRIPIKCQDLERSVPPGTFLVYDPATGQLQAVRPGEV